MALLDSEGFGLSTNLSDFASSGAAFSLRHCRNQALGQNGPLGDNFLNLASDFNGPPSCLRLIPGGPLDTVILGQRFNLASCSNEGWGVFLLDAAQLIQVAIRLDPINRTVALWRGGTLTASDGPEDATLVATSALGVIPPQGWFYLELKAVIADGTAGSIIVRVDNAPVLTLTGIDTKATNNPGATFTAWSTGTHYTQRYTFDQFFIAHFYLCDATGPAPGNDFLGDVRIQTLFPTADDGVQFTPHGNASNWQNAAQVPPNPAQTFNSDAVPGHQDTFVMADMGAGLSTVFGLHLKTLLAKTDAGPRTMSDVLVSGASTTTGPAVSVGTTPSQTRRMLAADPATSQPWTQAAVNAVKAGYRVVS